MYEGKKACVGRQSYTELLVVSPQEILKFVIKVCILSQLY